jgi:transcriptional regulator with XRE-family HTH domain
MTFVFVIQQARQERQLSLGALALKSGVSKATLSRWEAGKARPCAPELLKVLEVLSVSEATSRQCLQQLGTPQAERYLAQTISEEQKLPISGGELLRALRIRTARSQADTARAVGVTQALLSRWENNDCWPDSERLHALCFALRATQSELQGLTTRAWQQHDELPLDKDPLDLARRNLSILPHNVEHDLFYLAMGSRYQSLYKTNQIGKTDMLSIWGYFGSYLAWHHRLDEAYQMAVPVFEDMKGSHRVLLDGQLFALFAMSSALTRIATPQKGLEMMAAFEARIAPNDLPCWYDDLAEFAWKAGQQERAHFYHQKSIQTCPNYHIERYVRLRYAEQLCLHKNPREALNQALLCTVDPWNSHTVIHYKLVYGGALGLLGESGEASATLSQARQLLQMTPYPGLTDFYNKLKKVLPISLVN